MKNKNLILCGVLAPIVYVFAVILGGLPWSSYSHIAQPVSDLMANGSPHKSLLDPIFALYNLLTLAFGVGVLGYVASEKQNRRRMLGIVGSIVLIAEAVFGVFDIIFAEDAAGGITTTISTTGMLHIVFAGLCSLMTMSAILLIGFWLLNHSPLRQYGWYSFISVAVVFISGGTTAYGVANQTGWGGLSERITMGAWLVWMLVIGIKMCVSNTEQVSSSNQNSVLA